MKDLVLMLAFLILFTVSTFYLNGFPSPWIPLPMVRTVSEEAVLYPSMFFLFFDGLSQQVGAQFSSLCLDHFSKIGTNYYYERRNLNYF